MLFNELLAHPESETGTDVPLGREERIKDCFEMIVRDARSVVSDSNVNIGPPASFKRILCN